MKKWNRYQKVMALGAYRMERSLCHKKERSLVMVSIIWGQNCGIPYQSILEKLPKETYSKRNWKISFGTTFHQFEEKNCHPCDKKFDEISELRDHERVHTQEKPFNCDHYEKTKLAKLRGHEIVHNEKYPYNCHHCDKKLVQTSEQTWKNHTRSFIYTAFLH